MNPLILLRISLKALRKNVYRTFLTMLGIIIGVASVIAMLAIGEGSKKSIETSISNLGSNLIMVLPGSSHMGGARLGAGTSKPLEISEVEAIDSYCPAVQWVSPVVTIRAQLIAGSSNWFSNVLGSYSNYLKIRDIKLSSGRSFTEIEVRRTAKVCLLGQTVVEKMFGDHVDPIGKSIRINRVPFKIIGTLNSKGASMMGDDQDDMVIAPFFSVQRRLLGITYVQQIYVSAYSSDIIDQAAEEIRNVLSKNLEDDTFTIHTMSEISDMLSSTSQILVILLASVAGISLIVGGIGIMNIMYVTVTERTREIGLRMAVGAKSKVILLQFLFEAVVISVVGGALGIIFGITISKTFAQIMNWPISITIYSIVLSFGFSTLIGIFFGWYPARKASNLLPIKALRYE